MDAPTLTDLAITATILAVAVWLALRDDNDKTT